MIRAIQDRIEITDVLYRYASCIDRSDNDGVRSVLADDPQAQYGNTDPVIGGDAVANWIAESIAPVIWQHHLGVSNDLVRCGRISGEVGVSREHDR